MSLILNIINKENITPDHSPFFQFEEVGGSIGRNPLNDWIICDLQKFVSGKHASIFCKQGVYYMTDTSTNGIYLNGSSEPIGKNNSVPIKTGDKLTLGELLVEVTITSDIQISKPNHNLSNVSSNNTFLDDILGSSTSFPNESGLPGLINELNISQTVSIDEIEDELDPLALLGKGKTGDYAAPREAVFDSIGNNKAHDSLFKTPLGALPTIQIESESNDQNFIPEDWDFGQEPDSSPSDLTPKSIKNNDYNAIDIFDIIEPMSTEGKKNLTTQDQIKSEQNIDFQLALKTILDAAGLDSSEILKQAGAPDLELIGKMLRRSIDGLVIALMGRSQIKSGFRMSMTTITPIETNPLKFSINGEEALRSLLSTRHGYKAPLEAIDEGYNDLQSHQLAMMSAFQETIYSLVLQFNPNTLEKRFDSIRSNSLKLGGKKAHYWDCFNEHYNEIEQGVSEDFVNTLGQVFAEAYEEQLHKI